MDFKISVEPYILVKHSPEFLYKKLYYDFHEQNGRLPNEEENQELVNQSKSIFKKEEWEFPNEFVTQEDAKRWYGNNIKKVFMIEGKLRNKRCYDRAGSLDY